MIAFKLYHDVSCRKCHKPILTGQVVACETGQSIFWCIDCIRETLRAMTALVNLPTLKRYLLFEYTEHEAAGGWDDFVGAYDTENEARAVPRRDEDNCWHIVDGQTGEKIAGTDLTET